MTRARLIVNPTAGADRAPALLPLISARLRTIVARVDITVTSGEGDAEDAAAQALAEGCDALYVAGGDGTLNAVLRGIVVAGGPTPGMPIGVIPLGTGNDFAKALGLGEEPEVALEVLLERRVANVDIGLLNGRPFVNTSAGGFVADVSEAVTAELKDRTGKLAYLIGGARALLGSEPFTAMVDTHGSRAPAWAGAMDIRMFAVCNARFIGGGYPIAPSAYIDDGLLDVLVVPQMPMLEFVAVLQRIAAGEEEETPPVLHFRAASFDLTFNRTVRVNTDGELLEADRCSYEVRPKAGTFFCGASPQTVDRGALDRGASR